MATQFGMTPSSARATPTAVAPSRTQQQQSAPPPRTHVGMTPSSARQATPSSAASTSVVPPSTAMMDIIHDHSNEEDDDGVDDESNSSGNNFSVIIGKTFEAMTLPDGSQQIIETTKYKRLNDGCIYTTSKVRSLDEDDKSMSSEGVQREDAHVLKINEAREEVKAARALQESNKWRQQQPPPPPTARSKSPVKEYPSDNHDELPTFSSSYSDEELTFSSSLQPSVVTENYGFGNGERVEEFLCEDYTVVSRQSIVTQKNQQLSSRSSSTDNDGFGGWCAFGNDTPNSIRLGRPMNFWAFTPKLTGSASKMKSMFRLEEDGEVSERSDCIVWPLDCDRKDENSNDCSGNKRGSVPKTKWRLLNLPECYSRRCKLVTLVMIVIGAIISLTATLLSSRINEPQCVDLEIMLIATNKTEDINSWSLDHTTKGGVTTTIKSSHMQGDSLDTSYRYCVEPGAYTFTISDSSGNGLGSEGEGGYYITSAGVTLGISSFFFHEEKMSFQLPLNNAHDGDEEEDAVCSDDFFLAIQTDDNPNETTWNINDDDSGKEVLAGGPYLLPLSMYTHRACLPDGKYTFNMADAGDDGLCCTNGRGFYLLSKDGKTIMNSDGEFGSKNSVAFVLGEEDV